MKLMNTCGSASVLGLCALLAACEADTLSVGELRCRSVRCEPHPLIESVSSHGKQPRHVTVPEPVVPMTVELPCRGERCASVRTHLVLLDRAGEQSPLVAIEQELYDEGGSTTGWQIWIARRTGDEWDGEATIELESSGMPGAEVALAVTEDSEHPDEAIVAVSVRTALGPAHTLSVYRYAADDELELLFEDEHAGALFDIGSIEGDVVVASRFADVYELTRYGRSGTIVWRQTKIDSTLRAMSGGVSERDVALRVMDDDSIAVLLPRYETGHEIVVLGGKGEVSGRYVTAIAASIRQGAPVRLAAARSGAIEVAQSGYLLDRASIRDGELNAVTTGRSRKQYYDLNVYAFEVAESGWSYVATQDGLYDERVELLDRVSPERDTIESIPLAAAEPPCDYLLFEETDLRIARDEAIAYVATGSCFAVIPLPAHSE